ncbi:glycosyltransferase family 4 protein [Streptomyces sp. NPDC006692]|uniref:glycosyltransferase family 4 protein n=1 Tax=unclassified Streptomyces TaxID=2593676 RepID=UPI0036C2DA3A
MKQDVQLNFHANVRGKGSYAIVAREMVVALWRLGIDVVVEPDLAGERFKVDVGSEREDAVAEVLRRPRRSPDRQVHIRSLSRPNERELAALSGAGGTAVPTVPGALNVCLYAIDGTRPDPYAQYGPEQPWDLLGMPSTHSARALLTDGVDPHRVGVVPQGVDTRVFHPDVTPLDLPATRSFRFLLNSTPWIDRKNIKAAFEAYFTTFDGTDDVSLVVHCPVKESKTVHADGTIETTPVHEGIRDIGLQVQRETGSDAHVHYLFEDLSLADVARLNRACHCLVHPHRAEAFCLTIAEAMACGLPTIVTPWGGNTDYCSPETNLLIPFSLVHSVRASELSWAEPERSPIEWAEPRVDGIRRWMRWAVEHQDEAAAMGLRAAQHIQRDWSWEKACWRLIDILRDRFGVTVAHFPGKG